MSHDLAEQIICLANEFGGDVAFARAGGGNASYKHDGVLHIKPSGTTLAALRSEDLVPLRIDALLEALDADGPATGDPVMAAAEAARVGPAGGRRPSVEILFHALLPDSLVLHLHPLAANAVTCNERGRELCRELLGEAAVWVDYIDPGVPLARGIAATRREHEERTGSDAPGIILLGNHGIIVSGNDKDEVSRRVTWLTGTINQAIAATPEPSATAPEEVDVADLAELLRAQLGRQAVAQASDALVQSCAGNDAGPVAAGPTIPDQIVYAGSFPVVLERGMDASAVRDAVARHERQHQRPPITAVVPNRAVIAVGDTDDAARNALDTFRDALRVARDADRIGAYRPMDQRERHFIENWEAEAYRRSVAAES